MSSQARPAYGTKLKMGDGVSPETFTEIPEVGDIKGPNISVKTIDVTTHSSAASGANEEIIPSTMNGGEVSFPLNYVEADPMHVALIAAAQTRTKKNFQKVNPEATKTISFSGYVTDIAFADPVSDKRSADVTITVSGGLTFS
jgi:hypothetical protein